MGRAMVTITDFSRLVAGVYRAAASPQHWQPAIRDIHRALGGTGGSMLLGDGSVWSLQDSTLPVAALESYAKHYYQLDYVLAALHKAPVGVVRTGPEIIFRNRNREFYAGWMRPNELEDGLFVRLTGGPRPTCFLVVSPTRSFDTSERVQLMSELVPHLHQAVRTQDKLRALNRDAVDLAGALDAVRNGIVIVTIENVVVNLNSAAERILRTADSLCMRSRRITATCTQAERELHLAIHNALGGVRCAVRSGRSLICVRHSGKRPYVIHVLPAHRRDGDEPMGRPTALVLIIDPEDEPEPPAALLRRLYHLTKAEADVALQMVHGADAKQISDELSVSVTTVRTHLQHVFEKTDTHRQVELVRVLLGLRP
ncbi:DNA-binding protein [Mycobacterium gastri 'Wayne']|nr:DNA-binding protein [Mycobacterium gastri 'Wayne']